MSKVKEQLWHEPEHDLELHYKQEPIMHISKMISSKFVKSNDVDQPLLVTISEISEQNVAKENEPPEIKWSLAFSDYSKPLVLNVTNIQLCSSVCQSEDTDDWIGHQIVLYNDPTIMYGGKMTGGVRIRAPKNMPKPTLSSHDRTTSINDDIGF